MHFTCQVLTYCNGEWDLNISVFLGLEKKKKVEERKQHAFSEYVY